MYRDSSESNRPQSPFSLSSRSENPLVSSTGLPSLIVRAGDDAIRRFVEFFAVTIRNRNTRDAYAQATGQFFAWCENRGLQLFGVQPITIAAYVEHLSRVRSAPTVKQHLAAIRMCFDWLVTGHIVNVNPAWSVKGPRYVVKKGKTPVLTPTEARLLLDSIDTSTMIGLRDRALIGVMVYSFARVSAVVGMDVEDYYMIGKRSWIRLREKGGKHHEVPAHHNAAEYLDAYLESAVISDTKTTPLFRTASRKANPPGQVSDALTENRMGRLDVLRMIKRRAIAAGIGSDRICCHTFRATGITAYLENGGTLEHAQAIAAHESPRTTKLYDRTSDAITLDEVERISI